MGKNSLRSKLSEIYDVIETGSSLYSELRQEGNCDLQWVIPGYQRGYSWDKSNFNDFIDTLDELGEEISEEVDLKYFGQLILHIGEGNTLEIVDGQQRLTTFLILAKVLIELYETLNVGDYNKKDYNKLNSYVYMEDGTPRFKHLSKNKRVIEEYVYLLEPCTEAEDQIKKLYMEYEDKLCNPESIFEYREKLYSQYKKKYCKLKTSDYNSVIYGYKEIYKFCNEKRTQSKKFSNFETNLISTSVIMTSILMSDSFNMAYESFMSLNGKGRSLTTFDLIKSEFLGNLTNEDLGYNVEQDWDRQVDIKALHSKKIVEIFDIMLKIEYREFYYKFKSENAKPTRTVLRDMLYKLRVEVPLAEIYEKFKNYIEKYQDMIDGRFDDIISIKKFQVYNNDVSLALKMDYLPFQPLLFEFIKKPELQSEENLIEILKIIRYVPFVHVTVCGLRPSYLTDEMTKYLKPSNNLEEKYEDKLKHLKHKFINKNIQETFEANLPETNIKNTSVSKDILMLLEGIEGSSKHLNQLEHIYPQNARQKEWLNIDKSSLNRIGNHAIVSNKMNEVMSNHPFIKKMEIIEKDFSDDVVNYKYMNEVYIDYKNGKTEFTAEDVKKRGEKYTNDLVTKFYEIGVFE